MDSTRLIFTAFCLLLLPSFVRAQELPWHAAVNDASMRYEVPQEWIRSVIHAESKGNPFAISPKGAMGLMQLMPNTWVMLKERDGALDSPFNPQANILAGTAYLKDMYVKFGFPGLFAAYNAGPERYESYLKGQISLPQETYNYLRNILASLSKIKNPSAHISRLQNIFITTSSAQDTEKSNELFVRLSNKE